MLDALITEAGWGAFHPFMRWGLILLMAAPLIGGAGVMINIILSVWLERRKEQDFKVYDKLLIMFFLLSYGGMSLFVVGLVMAASDIIRQVFSSPWFIGPALLISGVLYWFRSNMPFGYGIAEMFVGTAGITLSIISAGRTLPVRRQVSRHINWLYVA